MITKLFEYVKNINLTQYLVKRMLHNMNKKLKNKMLNSNVEITNAGKYSYEFSLLHIKDYKLVKKLIDANKKIFLENNLVLSYNMKEEYTVEFKEDVTSDEFPNLSIEKSEPSGEYTFHVFIKELKTERFYPPKFLYHHSSESHRNNIKKYGLLPKESAKSPEWSGQHYLEYPTAIFATSKPGDWHGDDVWRIDTTNLVNKWWYDLNLFFSNRKDKKFVMTFEPIPPECLTLINAFTKEPFQK